MFLIALSMDIIRVGRSIYGQGCFNIITQRVLQVYKSLIKSKKKGKKMWSLW